MLDIDGKPISVALVEVLGHEEFAFTESRSDGYFDMVINGGGRLTSQLRSFR